jgi:acetolactate synthase-1/2/3 large subunit
LAGLPVALVESTPVLALTGQVQTNAYGRGAHQESTGWFGTPDQEKMFAAGCKQSATVIDASRAPDMMRHAIRIARAPRPGPTHLAFPANILHQRIDYTPLEPARYRLIVDRAVDASAVRRIAQRIREARAPALLMGARSRWPDCGPAAEALAQRHGLALATDLSCKSVVDEHADAFLGCLGVLGHKAAENFIKQEADLLITVGQTFDEMSTLSWDPALASGKDLVQLDVCASEIGKAYPAADAAVGQLAVLLEDICAQLDMAAPAPLAVRERRARIAGARSRWPLFQAADMSVDKAPLPPPRIVADLQAALPDDALILLDSSKWARWIGRYLQARRGQVICAHDYEPMGWAVAGAVGVKCAHPDRPVICVCGDGAFMMAAMEMSTAVNVGRDIIWMVMNDSRLGIIYDLQKGLYGGRVSGATFTNPDLPALAKAFGAYGETVSTAGGLTDSLTRALSRGGSCLLDVRFDPDDVPPVRPRSLLITKSMGLPDPTPGPETTRALIKLLKDK